jgi:hypothetical protein
MLFDKVARGPPILGFIAFKLTRFFLFALGGPIFGFLFLDFLLVTLKLKSSERNLSVSISVLGFGFGFRFRSTTTVKCLPVHKIWKKKIFSEKNLKLRVSQRKRHKNKLNGLLKEMKLRKKWSFKKKILKKWNLKKKDSYKNEALKKIIRKLFSTLNELKSSCGFRRISAFPTSRNGFLRKEKNVAKIQWKPLNVITLGRSLTNSINQMITIIYVLHL